jgi:hypothetical protein
MAEKRSLATAFGLPLALAVIGYTAAPSVSTRGYGSLSEM